MIKVDIHYKGDGLTSLRVKGHAESAEFPKDLVCAAVSATVVGALNALEELETYDINIEDGDVQVLATEPITDHDSIVFETMIIQLKTINESKPGFIEIREKKE